MVRLRTVLKNVQNAEGLEMVKGEMKKGDSFLKTSRGLNKVLALEPIHIRGSI